MCCIKYNLPYRAGCVDDVYIPRYIYSNIIDVLEHFPIGNPRAFTTDLHPWNPDNIYFAGWE